ncbi:DUF7005 family protein [Nostoc sp. ChiVER01]|uniref:DUF7005 family protein n=1 Tax=Nostoc sp. ChiVER01 TaxID=3075382 RepID=UPI002AD57F7E|nr:hypothetical protein [Nostoc sp. ChiVER01]MDZ8221771.1 hypothetical protein [Nostoc sp. ChiVER01]
MSNQHQLRANVLASYGASARETEELLAYNQNTFDHSFSTLPAKFPLPPEPHVAAWEEYATLAQEVGVFQALSTKLVQLKFPILKGISQTEAYRFATRKGIPVDSMIEATSLILQQPEQLQLMIHQSLAGAIPVLLTRNRKDFVSLLQALTMRNEPKPVPASMGACMIIGLNNWDRVRQYRQQWEVRNFGNCSESSWLEEFGRLIPQKQLYQDRLMILSDGFYSNVSASDIGLSQPEWRRISLNIRLEHECTHYFTQRLFGSMRNNLLDELIADYRGIVAAIGHYRADWFLRFLGLELFPDYREGGRLQNYQGQPPLSEGAFKILQALVKSAAENLERFDAEHGGKLRTLNSQPIMLIALTYLTLEELADSQAHSYIQKILDQWLTTLTNKQAEHPETELKFI